MTSGRLHWRPVQTCSIGHLQPDPLKEWHLVAVTETGSTYGWQAGGTHRTKMPSCLKL